VHDRGRRSPIKKNRGLDLDEPSQRFDMFDAELSLAGEDLRDCRIDGFLPPLLYDRVARRFVELAEQERVKVTPRHDDDTARHSVRDVAEPTRSAQEKPVVGPKLLGPDKLGNEIDD
jgi:hypothetical protein